MAWDWDAADIDLDEDDGQVWVPVMPKTLEELIEELQGMPKMPETKQPVINWEDGRLWNMAVYAVSDSLEGAVQADAPSRQVVLSLQVPGLVVILDMGELSDLMELSEAEAREETSEGQMARRKAVTVVKAAGVGWKGIVPKCAPVVMSSTPHETSCDQCHRIGQMCFSRRKGGQELRACLQCYKAKIACKMGWWGSTHADTDDGQWLGSSKLGIRTGGSSVGEVWSGPVISPRMWLKYLMQMMIKKIEVFFCSFSSIPAFCLYTVPRIKVINQYDKK